MKYLYLEFPKLRVWFLRRRLRRMGFRDAVDRTNAQTLLHLKMEHGKRPSRILRWLEIGLLITGPRDLADFLSPNRNARSSRCAVSQEVSLSHPGH